MSERQLDPNLLNSLEVMFGRRLQTANLEEIPRLSVQMANTPELFSFLDQHGILSVTVEPQGNIVWVSNFKRHKDSNKEVVGDNGPDVQNALDYDNYECISCGISLGGNHRDMCKFKPYKGLADIKVDWVHC